MFKILPVLKDTYITDKIINNVRSYNSNVGRASTLDLYKLYGETLISGTAARELSRLLIQFDLTSLQTLIQQHKIDITNETFNVQLKLFDVYGGQPTPENFVVDVFPLSQSFEEGRGKDIVRYADYDSCNFLTASYPNNLWLSAGANLSGTVPSSCDYFSTLITNNDLKASQTFITGEENLCIDVTKIISATLTNQIPDQGFRISFSESLENDTRTYFVKRFAGKNAYNEDYHPQLIVRYNDAMLDDALILELDYTNNVFLYNYRQGVLTNLLSSSVTLTGSNCVSLKLLTPISGGYYELTFSGSQYSTGTLSYDGIYTSNVFVPSSNTNVQKKLLETGSIDFTPVWTTNDNSITFVSGSTLTFYSPYKNNGKIDHNHYSITTTGLRNVHTTNEQVLIRVNIFDYTSPLIKFVRKQINLPGIVLRNVYYQVRDFETGDIVIPFDTIYKSTLVSSDNEGMYFQLDTSNLKNQRSYIIDILISMQGENYTYHNVSNAFKINNLTQ